MRATCLLLLALALPGGATLVMLPADAPDATLQTFLDSEADTLVLTRKPGGWITGPLWFRNSGRTLILRPGVEIRARAGAFSGRGDCLLTLENVRNVTILGYGARLVMRKPEYRDGEWRHGLSIRGSRDVKVEGLAIDSSGGDGIYIDGWWNNRTRYSEDITIRNVRLRGHRRQGISVISAQNLLIEHVVAEGTAGTDPEAGIDFEPDDKEHRIVNVRVRNSVFRGNAGPPVLVYLNKFAGETLPVSLTFENCLFSRSPHGRPARVAAFPDALRGTVTFERSVFRAEGGIALVLDNKSANAAEVKLMRVTIERTPNAPGDSAVVLRFEQRRRQPRFGPLGGVRGEELILGAGARLEFVGRDALWVSEKRGIRLAVFTDAIPQTPGDVEVERLTKRPAWPPPPPLPEFRFTAKGGLEVRLANWASDSVRYWGTSVGWRNFDPSTWVLLRSRQHLRAVALRGGLVSDTLELRVPSFEEDI